MTATHRPAGITVRCLDAVAPANLVFLLIRCAARLTGRAS